MKTTLSLICFTQNGAAAAARLLNALGEDFAAAGFVRSRFAGGWDTKSLTVWQGSLHDWTVQQFPKSDCLVFVGACGIAVRAIAPFVADKLHDPAVVVIDEKGQFCIPLLSGHVGRANELAGYFAKILGALPIITTATDLNGLFAVDVFAQKNELVLTDRAKAKAISAALLAGQKVALFSDFPIRGKLPEGATMIGQNAGDWRICISFCNPDRPDTLWLPPRRLVLGIGCRRGVLEKTIEAFVSAALQKAGVPLEAVRAVCSIDLKKEEAGLLGFCQSHHLPLTTYSAGQLSEAPGTFSPSGFVKQVTGVDNVCERAAVLGAGGGELLLPKQAGGGVTAALAVEKEITLSFSDQD